MSSQKHHSTEQITKLLHQWYGRKVRVMLGGMPTFTIFGILLKCYKHREEDETVYTVSCTEGNSQFVQKEIQCIYEHFDNELKATRIVIVVKGE